MWLSPTSWSRPIGTIAQFGQALAERWEKAVTSAVSRVIKNPASGAPCKFRSAELRNVKRTTTRGFPKHLLFYRIRGAELFKTGRVSSNPPKSAPEPGDRLR
jgi:hypothetical protein